MQQIPSRLPAAAGLALSALLAAGAATAAEAPVMMTPEWAKGACAAWNANPTLTDKLHESGWVTNDKQRGYKVLHVYRADCPDSARVELRISAKDGRAECVYGGAVENAKLDDDVDYLMYAETTRWKEMGAGEYGPMRAMFFQRLLFEGPKMEAMSNMGPFGEFLKLTGAVPGVTDRCP